jgi:hypothetical protein
VRDEGETADMTRLAQQVLREATDLGNYERDKRRGQVIMRCDISKKAATGTLKGLIEGDHV